MSTTPVVVEAGTARYTSTSQTAEDIIRDLAPPDPEKDKPREVKDGEEEKDETSQAASVLGKKGGKAAAKARKEKDADDEALDEAKERYAAKHAPDKAAKPKEAAETTKAGEAEGDTDEDDAALPDGRAKQRVEEKARKAKAAEQEATRQRDRADRLERELSEVRRAKPAEREPEPKREAADADPRPKSADFENWDDYEDSRDQWNRRQWTREEAKKAAVRAEHEQVVTTVKTFQEAIRETLADEPDFWDNVPEIHDTTPLGQLIVRAGGNAPGILRYLSENSDEHERLSKMSDPYELIDAIGQIKGTIAARTGGATAGKSRPDERQASKPAETKAKPHPVRPVSGSPSVETGEPDDKAPLSAYVHRFGNRELNRSAR